VIVYNKTNGNIIAILDDNQNIESCFIHYSEDFKSNLALINLEEEPYLPEQYKIVDGELVKKVASPGGANND